MSLKEYWNSDLLMSQLTCIETGKILQYYFISSVSITLTLLKIMSFTLNFLECLWYSFNTLQNIFLRKCIHKSKRYVCIYSISNKGERGITRKWKVFFRIDAIEWHFCNCYSCFIYLCQFVSQFQQ